MLRSGQEGLIVHLYVRVHGLAGTSTAALGGMLAYYFLAAIVMYEWQRMRARIDQNPDRPCGDSAAWRTQHTRAVAHASCV